MMLKPASYSPSTSFQVKSNSSSSGTRSTGRRGNNTPVLPSPNSGNMTRPPYHILDYLFILNVLEKSEKAHQHIWDSHLTSKQRLYLIFNLHAELLYPVLLYLKK